MFHMQFVLGFNKHLIKIDFFIQCSCKFYLFSCFTYCRLSKLQVQQKEIFMQKGWKRDQMINLGSNKARILTVFKDANCKLPVGVWPLGHGDGEHGGAAGWRLSLMILDVFPNHNGFSWFCDHIPTFHLSLEHFHQPGVKLLLDFPPKGFKTKPFLTSVLIHWFRPPMDFSLTPHWKVWGRNRKPNNVDNGIWSP